MEDVNACLFSDLLPTVSDPSDTGNEQDSLDLVISEPGLTIGENVASNFNGFGDLDYNDHLDFQEEDDLCTDQPSISPVRMMTDEEIAAEFIKCSEEGNLSRMKQLVGMLDKDKSKIEWLLQQKNEINYTPLHAAANAGHTNIVKYLLEELEAPRNPEPRGHDLKAIQLAARNGHVEATMLLCEPSISNVMQKTYQASALRSAIDCGKDQVVSQLLALFPSLATTKTARSTRLTLLHYAAAGGSKSK